MEKLVLVNEKDRKIGLEEKIKTHQKGLLHRAFSIFIFNSEGKLLIQKRARSKYHSAGLWTNTCCSHPRPNEKLKEGAKRRLREEMGIKSDLREIFSFNYRAELGGLIEHEFDHVFVGKFDGRPKPNKREVEDWQWVEIGELKRDIKKNPKKYTFWFKKILDKVLYYQNGKI